METLSLTVQKRNEGKQITNLRKEGFIPGVIYGPDIKSQNLKVLNSDFENIFNKSRYSTLIDLKVENEAPIKVVVQEVQKDPVSSNIIHIDFFQVNLKEKLTTDVKLNFVGESIAVKSLGGVFLNNLSELKIKCLPEDLISVIDVDISTLETFDDSVRVKDLNIPSGIEVLNEPKRTVATVLPPRIEEEKKVVEAEEEGEGEEKSEGDEKPEGDEKEKEEEKPAEKKEKKS